MRTALLLNDKRIAWYEDGREKYASPGFIYAEKQGLHFGERAEQQSRLHPLNTHHGFWHRLSQDPFSRPVVNCRHAADLVFAHLNNMFESGKSEDDAEQQTLLLTPASYNESQLALLSGVARHSQFRPAWMMPIPLAVVGSQLPDAEVCVVVEQYQHGLTLSLIRQQQHALICDNAQQLPDLGYYSMTNKLLQAASDAFVAQTRYNPQQNAAWEQSLYDDLPRWLRLLNQRETVIPCQIQTGNQEISATLQAVDCMDELAPSLEKLQQQWQGVKQDFGDVPVLLAGNSHLIPGLVDIFATQQVKIVEDHEVISFASGYVSRLASDTDSEGDQSVSLVKDIRLALLAMSDKSANTEKNHFTGQAEAKSSCPFGSAVYWLAHGVARAVSSEAGCRLGLIGNVVSDLSSVTDINQAHVKISGSARVEKINGLTAQLNGRDVMPGAQLMPGDVLSLGEQQVTFIAVENDIAVDHGSQA